ncbi:MAG TPA: SUMF1/EgtB/PvdO family nonheme iron enzyme, partial [Pyrinomonadaceae bacterium]|nr:SUMF1/EgtB/PvdO family nonheme iron enzyme [Pyrinomonadaceae bacterium]
MKSYGPQTCFLSALLTLAFMSSCQQQVSKADGMVLIPGGAFHMGTDDGMPFEAPVHDVLVKSFWIDKHEVTVSEFARFIEATNYVTDAEIFGWSVAFDIETGEWKRIDGANWRHPEGGNAEADANEPVVQVSWSDAAAYAKWA